MILLYFGGIVMGILMALLWKTMFKGEAVPFVMKLPNYRMPGAKNVGHLAVGIRPRIFSESVYRYFCCNHCDLVFTDL